MPVTLGLSTLDGVEVFGLRPWLIFVPQWGFAGACCFFDADDTMICGG